MALSSRPSSQGRSYPEASFFLTVTDEMREIMAKPGYLNTETPTGPGRRFRQLYADRRLSLAFNFTH